MVLDIKNLEVNKTHCKSCPFNSSNPNVHLINDVVNRNLQNWSSQVCHATEGSKREPRSLCRGHRNLMLKMFFALGFLKEPTDEAWEEAWKEINSEGKIKNGIT